MNRPTVRKPFRLGIQDGILRDSLVYSVDTQGKKHSRLRGGLCCPGVNPGKPY